MVIATSQIFQMINTYNKYIKSLIYELNILII